MTKIVTRFAPSPTGLLHIGNVRTALVNYLYTKQNNGKFNIRLDDTDYYRSKKQYEESIIKDLKWLEIKWDLLFRHSNNLKKYDDIASKLIKDEILYACYDTEEELEIKRKLQLSRGMPPIYDRSSLKLSKQQRKSYEQEVR